MFRVSASIDPNTCLPIRLAKEHSKTAAGVSVSGSVISAMVMAGKKTDPTSYPATIAGCYRGLYRYAGIDPFSRKHYTHFEGTYQRRFVCTNARNGALAAPGIIKKALASGSTALPEMETS